MHESKFTMNAFLGVVLIFSAILFFFTTSVTALSNRAAINDYYRIEGTGLAIVYSNRKPNGLYEGPEQTAVLRVEGSFGHDWGIALEEPYLYVNEYADTALGLMHCRLVQVDLDTFETRTLFEDAVLRGRCASGELVCISDFFMPSIFPETNSMCRLYAMAASGATGGDCSEVLLLDPATAEVVARFPYDEDIDERFDEAVLACSLEEIVAEAGL